MPLLKINENVCIAGTWLIGYVLNICVKLLYNYFFIMFLLSDAVLKRGIQNLMNDF